jgi:threonine synthase
VNFISTRTVFSGGAPETSFADVLLAGLAPDGGLYLPQHWPQFSAGEIAAFRDLDWNEAAFRILSRFTEGAFARDELRQAIAAAYAGFDVPEVAPLTPLADGQFLLELFHGPTLAFKDVALQILGQLFSRALARRGGRASVVAATSGDTGSAAIAALGGLPNIDVFVMHPKGRVSRVQRLQMTTSSHANVHNIALEGSFDDAQSIVKRLFADADFARDVSLTAVNSINFARIAAQAIYYFTAAARLDVPVTFVVPTGNFGDVFAGEAAMRMGLPVRKLVIATNANDILVRALETGVYAPGPSHATLSPSMDIQVASNFERALFEASGRDAGWIAAAMAGFARDRRLELPAPALAALRARYDAHAFDDAATLATIAAVKAETGRILDPHTAVAASAGRLIGPRLAQEGAAAVILSTAHPAKFPDAVARATGAPPPVPGRLAALEALPERMETLPPDDILIKRFISSRLGL